MIQFISLLIPSISIFIYMILSSIEFGTSFFQLNPNILIDDTILKKYIQPVWEVTNVFLVFAIVSIFTFFPGATYYLGTNLLVPISLGLTVLGLRGLFLMIIYYKDSKKHIIKFLFFLTSFIAPVLLSNIFIYFLTGSIN